MAHTDPIADLLTRIRNGLTAKHRYVDLGWSKLKENIAEILKEQGFIDNYLVKIDPNQRGVIRIFLKYAAGYLPAIKGIKRISKPGCRRYVGYKEIPDFYGNLGLSIISTSEGVLAGHQAAQKKVGGELLCLVW